MECPYCKSKRIQGTNIGKRVFAGFCAFAAGAAGHMIAPALGVTLERETRKQICSQKEYICLDCKREFSVEN